MFPKIGGKPPKSSILIGFSLINHPFWGTTIFGNNHLCALDCYLMVFIIVLQASLAARGAMFCGTWVVHQKPVECVSRRLEDMGGTFFFEEMVPTLFLKKKTQNYHSWGLHSWKCPSFFLHRRNHPPFACFPFHLLRNGAKGRECLTALGVLNFQLGAQTGLGAFRISTTSGLILLSWKISYRHTVSNPQDSPV